MLQDKEQTISCRKSWVTRALMCRSALSPCTATGRRVGLCLTAAGLQGTTPACQRLRQPPTKGLKPELLFALSYTLETPLISKGSHGRHKAALGPFSPTICKLIFT